MIKAPLQKQIISKDNNEVYSHASSVAISNAHFLPKMPLNTVRNTVTHSMITPKCPPPSAQLQNNLQSVSNSPSKSAGLEEKMALYKTHVHYGYTPHNSVTMLAQLHNTLADENIASFPHIDTLNSILPLLTIMQDALLSPNVRATLSRSQLVDINSRESLIRELIAAAASLPCLLLSLTDNQLHQNKSAAEDALKKELVQAALHRVPHLIEQTEAGLYALLHSPPPMLRNLLNTFLEQGTAKLLKPHHEDHCNHLRKLKRTVSTARHFIRHSNSTPCMTFPLSSDAFYAIQTVTNKINDVLTQLTLRLQESRPTARSPAHYYDWLSLKTRAFPATARRIFHQGKNHIKNKLITCHRHINREQLTPFTLKTLKPFLSLSPKERSQWLSLKKRASSLNHRLETLSNATSLLRQALHRLHSDNSPRLLNAPHTLEEALHFELILLTYDNAEVSLHHTLTSISHTITEWLKKSDTTSYFDDPSQPKQLIFSDLIQEYEALLHQAFYDLQQTLHQIQWNPHQKTIYTTLDTIEKTIRDIKTLIPNALQALSNVALDPDHQWLRKLDIDLQTHWQGITRLLAKGYKFYTFSVPSRLTALQGKRIHLTVLPLLNEIEKYLGATHLLQNALNAFPIDNQTVIENIKYTEQVALVSLFAEIEHTFSNNEIRLYHYSKQDDFPLRLSDILTDHVHELIKLGGVLQNMACLVTWTTEKTEVRQTLLHLQRHLRTIKADIKNAIDAATGIRPHINSQEGMIAKDAGEWLAEVKKHSMPTKDSLPNEITKMIDCLSQEFTTPMDPHGEVFRLRVQLALQDAEQGTLIWGLSARDHLNQIKSPRDYTLAWAEKRLTYGMLYNCVIHHTPVAMFSFSLLKNSIVSPLRWLNLLLTPIRMAVTRSAMKKTQPGAPYPADLIAEYTLRERYQAVFRLVSILTPQLVKTTAALGISVYGITNDDTYRQGFLTRAISRLPADLFWVGGFAAGQHGIRAVNNMLKMQKNRVLTPEQRKQLQEKLISEILNNKSDLPVLERLKRNGTENNEEPVYPELAEKIRNRSASDLLLQYSSEWKNASGYQFQMRTGSIPKDGDVYVQYEQQYVYLRGFFWEITQINDNIFFITAAKENNDPVRCEVTLSNNRWYLTSEKAINDNLTESIRSERISACLLTASNNWIDPTEHPFTSDLEFPPVPGDMYIFSEQMYIYIRGQYWAISPIGKNKFILNVKTKDTQTPEQIKLTFFDNKWDINISDSVGIPLTPSPEETLLNLHHNLEGNLIALSRHYHEKNLILPSPEETSLIWWLQTKWKNTQPTPQVPPYPLRTADLDGHIFIDTASGSNGAPKIYLRISPHVWEYKYPSGHANKGTLINKLGQSIDIININNQWYLNNWNQQRNYLYETQPDLNVLSERSQTLFEDIMHKIFQRWPDLTFESAIKLADGALSVLMLENRENKMYIMDALEIKYALMLIVPDKPVTLFTEDQIAFIHPHSIPLNMDMLKDQLSQLYPTDIDIKKYDEALKRYYCSSDIAAESGNDNDDSYYSGIVHSIQLIKKSCHYNNRLIFNRVLFELTKKEIMILNDSTPTEEKNNELVKLNIAKYHLYTSAKYLNLYDNIRNHIETFKNLPNSTMLSATQHAQIEAVKIYYQDRENLSQIELTDEEALLEYENIIALDNDASHYLDLITAVLYYKGDHPGSQFGGFDFIEARFYYTSRMERFIRDLYIFNVLPPENFISHNEFQPSTKFSYRSDYTKQFNDYVDNGSSDYESKLLTSLLLGQLDVNLADISYPPKRWFTLKFICYDHIKSHNGWPIHETFVWPEDVHVIQLHNRDYLTISQINGNLQVNIMKEDVYNFCIGEKAKDDKYYYAKSDDAFLNSLIGPIPETTQWFRECELRFSQEMILPKKIKEAVQYAVHGGLDALAGYQKDALETVSLTRNVAEILVPFYREIYHSLTDTHYSMNKTSLLLDFIFVGATLESMGIKLTTLQKIPVNNFIKLFMEGRQENGLRSSALAEFVASRFPKKYITPNSVLTSNNITEIITSIPMQTHPLDVVREEHTLLKVSPPASKFPLNAQVDYAVTLGKSGEFGHYKGIYKAPSLGEEENYFIKHDEQVYQVRWDNNKCTWRLIENQRNMGARYGMPIRYISENNWTYNFDIGLRGGGLETERIITKTEQNLSHFEARKEIETSVKPTNVSQDIFTSEAILTENAQLIEIHHALHKAKREGITLLNQAINVVKDKSYTADIKKLIKIFTNRTDEKDFLFMLNTLKISLKNLSIGKNIKLVNVDDSSLFAQIKTIGHSSYQDKFLAINYAAYNKNKNLIFNEATKVNTRVKDYYANENFARVLIHEFTHVNEIIRSTDAAGYIELLNLDAKHDVTKLLLKAKLELPEVRNNADSLTEIIMILAKTDFSPLFIEDFLEEYQKWDIKIEQRIAELKDEIRILTAQECNLSWDTTIKTEKVILFKEYNKLMSERLISEITDNTKVYFNIGIPLNHPHFGDL